MIIKEWTKEEIEKLDRHSFLDAMITGYYDLPLSRHNAYRFVMPVWVYCLAKVSHDSNNLPAVFMVRGGQGELLGYPIVIDNSVHGLMFEEYFNLAEHYKSGSTSDHG